MKNRILALIDFSEYSKTVVEVADQFAKTISAEIVFIHQMPEVLPVLPDVGMREEIIEMERGDREDELKELCAGIDNQNITFHIDEKDITEVLTGLKDDTHQDWVFTGLKGTGFWKRLFIGSTTIKIIDQTNFLTLSFPVKKEVFLPKKIVVATHYKFPINKVQFDHVIESLSGVIKEIDFISLAADDDDEVLCKEYLVKLEKEYSKFTTDMHVFKDTNKADFISYYMRDKRDTYLVLQQGSRKAKDSLFRKFLVNEFIYNESIPLIIMSE